MKYTINHPSHDVRQALGLTKQQARHIEDAVTYAYEKASDNPNIDEINAGTAPTITTPEEAFYAAFVISSLFLPRAIHQQEKIKGSN